MQMEAVMKSMTNNINKHKNTIKGWKRKASSTRSENVIVPDASLQSARLLGQHNIVEHLAAAQECHPAVRSHGNTSMSRMRDCQLSSVNGI
jgi:hypothetical protein